MGAISFSLDARLAEFFARSLPLRGFVETGTFRGDSLAVAKQYFPECWSVEKSPELFELTQKRFENQTGVHLQLGDSASFLKEHRSQWSAMPLLFWLDAHWCEADNTSGAESQSPLLEELAGIGSLHPKSALLIDDARLYLCVPPAPHRGSDWPDFQSVLSALATLSAAHRVMVLNDVIVFYPAAMAPAMREFACQYGVDWLTVANDHRAFRERRARRFPSPGFFRHLIRRRRT